MCSFVNNFFNQHGKANADCAKWKSQCLLTTTMIYEEANYYITNGLTTMIRLDTTNRFNIRRLTYWRNNLILITTYVVIFTNLWVWITRLGTTHVGWMGIPLTSYSTVNFPHQSLRVFIIIIAGIREAWEMFSLERLPLFSIQRRRL